MVKTLTAVSCIIVLAGVLVAQPAQRASVPAQSAQRATAAAQPLQKPQTQPGQKVVAQKAAEKNDGGNDPEAVDLLRQIEVQHGAVRTVTGTFRQHTQDPTFKEEKSVDATFKMLKPNNFRVDYDGKDKSTSLITGRTFYNYTPSLKQVTKYQFKNEASVRDVTYLLLGFGAQTEELLKVYTIKKLQGGRGVRLIPRNKGDANFKNITMEVTEGQNVLPKRFGMEQTDGTLVTVDLNVASLNMRQPLSDRDFRPDFGGIKPVDMQ